MALLEYLGPLVGRLRVARNLSQEKLAHLCGLHATTISEIERSKTGVTLATLEALARGLGIEPGHLLIMAVYGEQASRAPEIGSKARGTGYGTSTRQLRFPIVAERTSTGYSAYSPDLPGCTATGRSPEEVEHAMHQAITAQLQRLRQEGSPIPEPSSYTTIVNVTV
jgi:predicted RNase H-like HicB family nuclease/DNA-binding Xre family transcriptional regulator